MMENNDIDNWIRVLLNGGVSPRKLFSTLENFDKEELLNSLIRCLDNKLSSTRERAAEALGIIGDDLALYALENILINDNDSDVRRLSAWALGEIKNPLSVFPLIKTLEEDLKWPVRAQSALSLGNIGDDLATEFLIRSLIDENWHVRKNAATALGNLGDERAITPLIRILNDTDTDVRRKSMFALEKFADKSVHPLTEALKNGDPVIRMNSAEILGKIGDSRALGPLIKALDSSNKRNNNRYVRGKVAEALGKLGDDRAVKILQKEANAEFVYVRNKASEALEKIRSDGTSTRILQYYDDEIFFEYPNSWVMMSPSRKNQLLKGKHTQYAIEFSLQKIKNDFDISLEELVDIFQEVFYDQEFDINSENIYHSGEMEVYKMFGENTSLNKAVMILGFKLNELVYCLIFKGKIKIFEKTNSDIELITSSFLLNDYDFSLQNRSFVPRTHELQ